MQERNLEFMETVTIEQFKAAAKCALISVITSPKTGKHFMVNEAGASLGAVATKVAQEGPTKPLVISKVQDKDEQKPFFMLHFKGEGGSTPLFTL